MPNYSAHLFTNAVPVTDAGAVIGILSQYHLGVEWLIDDLGRLRLSSRDAVLNAVPLSKIPPESVGDEAAQKLWPPPHLLSESGANDFCDLLSRLVPYLTEPLSVIFALHLAGNSISGIGFTAEPGKPEVTKTIYRNSRSAE